MPPPSSACTKKPTPRAIAMEEQAEEEEVKVTKRKRQTADEKAHEKAVQLQRQIEELQAQMASIDCMAILEENIAYAESRSESARHRHRNGKCNIIVCRR